MKMTTSTDYAIQILRHLHRSKGEPQTAMYIITSVDMTSPLFVKIANRLRKGGLLHTTQRRNGSFQLGKPAETISLYDVFVCTEGEMHTHRCSEVDNRCDHGKTCNCKVYKSLNILNDKVADHLSNLSIADLER